LIDFNATEVDLSAFRDPIEALGRAAGALSLPLRTLQKSVLRQPEIEEREQCSPLRGVLHQPSERTFTNPELAFDHSKRVLHLGPDARLQRTSCRGAS
jgi:hypothetical protein